MTMSVVGERLNEYLASRKYGRLLLKAAAPLFLAPILLRLAVVLANADILWELDRYLFNTTIFHVRDILTNDNILLMYLADFNRLVGLFGVLLLFAKGKHTLLGSGFALAGFTYLFESLPYWLSGNFGGELLPMSIAYVICICAFSALSAASFREARRVNAEGSDIPESPVKPLWKPKSNDVRELLAIFTVPIAAIIVVVSSLIVSLPYFGFIYHGPPPHIPKTTLAEDCAVDIPKYLRAYYYTYSASSEHSCQTTAEPDPDGGYTIEKDSYNSEGPQVMHISYEQYLELTELFDDYGILALDGRPSEAGVSYDISLSVFSPYGDETRYRFAMEDPCGADAKSTIGEFYWALEKKYLSFGQWSAEES